MIAQNPKAEIRNPKSKSEIRFRGMEQTLGAKSLSTECGVWKGIRADLRVLQSAFHNPGLMALPQSFWSNRFDSLSDFGFRPSFGFRIPDFGLRRPHRRPQP